MTNTLEYLFTYRNRHGDWSEVWAKDTVEAGTRIKGRDDAPRTFYTISRVTNVPPRNQGD